MNESLLSFILFVALLVSGVGLLLVRRSLKLYRRLRDSENEVARLRALRSAWRNPVEHKDGAA